MLLAGRGNSPAGTHLRSEETWPRSEIRTAGRWRLLIGQFLTRDPALSLSGSAYGYADGGPIGRKDPSGLCNAGVSDTWSASFSIPKVWDWLTGLFD